MKRPRLFAELFCGSAAVSLALVGGRSLKPPVAYMGSKRGYAPTILAAMGLRCGQGADALFLNDAGPWGLVWQTLAAPGGAEAVAAVIHGWKDEDPRGLWERLRSESPPDFIGVGEPNDVARWMMLGVWSYRQGDPTSGGCVLPGDRRQDTSAVAVAAVARWLVCGAWAYRTGQPESGLYVRTDGAPNVSINALATATRGAGILPMQTAASQADARLIAPPDDAEGCWVYLDPPYQDTTGYVVECPRSDVVAIARRWADAGATVCISEASPLADDFGSGWDAMDITPERKGQARTFSVQQREWLTMNRTPAYRVAHQTTLWAP